MIQCRAKSGRGIEMAMACLDGVWTFGYCRDAACRVPRFYGSRWYSLLTLSHTGTLRLDSEAAKAARLKLARRSLSVYTVSELEFFRDKEQT